MLSIAGEPLKRHVWRKERRINTEPTSSERAAYEWIAQSLPKGYWAVVLLMAALVIFCWIARGPDHPIYGLVVVGWTLVLGPAVAVPVMRRVPRSWFRVPAGERVLHRLLGVRFFRWLLDRSGWDRHLHKRIFHATKVGLLSLEVALRSNASAHGFCFVVHLLLTAVAFFTGHPWGALWILLPGVVVHFYPVLLQRSIMFRIQPLLDKSGSLVRADR